MNRAVGRSARAFEAGVLAALLGAGAIGCSAARLALATPVPAAPVVPVASHRDAPRIPREPPQPILEEAAPAPVEPVAIEPLSLPIERSSRDLPAGRSLVEIAIPDGHLVSIGVFGAVDALLDFDLVEPPAASAFSAHAPLDEDGRLPFVLSFAAPPGVDRVSVWIDASEPVSIARVVADPARAEAPDARALRLGSVAPRPLIGLPAPLSRAEGYLLESPGRYQFIRLDLARSLRAALRQTRVRFRRDPIAVGDISQWNGDRPASDLGHPRHISHAGGRDVDLALPANDEDPSIFRPHCTGVLVSPDTYVCAPGSDRGLDALRLAYLLGLLVDGFPYAPGAADPRGPQREYVEKIFLDDAFIREVRRASETLRSRRWIRDAGFAALSEEGILRASPWHTDHVHVRFTGEHGRAPFDVVAASARGENE